MPMCTCLISALALAAFALLVCSAYLLGTIKLEPFVQDSDDRTAMYANFGLWYVRIHLTLITPSIPTSGVSIQKGTPPTCIDVPVV